VGDLPNDNHTRSPKPVDRASRIRVNRARPKSASFLRAPPPEPESLSAASGRRKVFSRPKQSPARPQSSQPPGAQRRAKPKARPLSAAASPAAPRPSVASRPLSAVSTGTYAATYSAASIDSLFTGALRGGAPPETPESPIHRVQQVLNKHTAEMRHLRSKTHLPDFETEVRRLEEEMEAVKARAVQEYVRELAESRAGGGASAKITRCRC
jgi:hypothetical protein